MRDKEAREEISAIRLRMLDLLDKINFLKASNEYLSASQILDRFQEIYDFLKVKRQTETTKTVLKKKA